MSRASFHWSNDVELDVIIDFRIKQGKEGVDSRATGNQDQRTNVEMKYNDDQMIVSYAGPQLVRHSL